MVVPAVQVVDITANAAILLLTGQVDACSCDSLHREISAVMTRHHPHCLVLDVSLVKYISSSGICLFTSLVQDLAAAGGCLVFVGMPEWVCKPFDMLGYARNFDFRDSMYDAMQKLPAI